MKFELVHTGNAKVEKALNGLFASLSTEFRYGVMRKVANLYYQETLKRFEMQYDVDRKKWYKNTEATQHLKLHGLYNKQTSKNRSPAKRGPNHVGIWTEKLKKTLKVNVGYQEATIGSDQIYSKTFHYGAKKGSFGKNVPWGDIPPRRFLGRNNRLDNQVILLIRDAVAEKIGLKGVDLGRDYL